MLSNDLTLICNYSTSLLHWCVMTLTKIHHCLPNYHIVKRCAVTLTISSPHYYVTLACHDPLSLCSPGVSRPSVSLFPWRVTTLCLFVPLACHDPLSLCSPGVSRPSVSLFPWRVTTLCLFVPLACHDPLSLCSPGVSRPSVSLFPREDATCSDASQVFGCSAGHL